MKLKSGMKSKLNLKALLLSAMCSVVTPASALDLVEAMQLAQQYDTTFQAAYANYLAAIEAGDQRTSAVLPQVGFNAFLKRGETETDRDGTVTESDDNSDGYSINLTQVIYDKTTSITSTRAMHWSAKR